VAHLVAGVQPADVGYKPASASSFTGPVLQSYGAPDGIAFPQVSAYLELPAGQYLLRAVASDAPDCSTPIDTGMELLVTLSAGTYSTVAAMADGSAMLRAFPDEPGPWYGGVKLRFIHAAASLGPVDAGLGAGADFQPTFTGVQFGTAGVASGQVFVASGPLVHAQASVRRSGTTTDLTTVYLDAAAGTIQSLFLIGIQGNPSSPIRLLTCSDQAPPVGLFSNCSLAPPAGIN